MATDFYKNRRVAKVYVAITIIVTVFPLSSPLTAIISFRHFL